MSSLIVPPYSPYSISSRSFEPSVQIAVDNQWQQQLAQQVNQSRSENDWERMKDLTHGLAYGTTERND